MLQHAAIAVLVIAVPAVVQGQDPQRWRGAVAWSRQAAWDPAWSVLADTATVVLEDSLSIRCRGLKPAFFNVFFERRQVIRFGSEDGALRHGRFILPESLDPAYDQRHIPWEQRNGLQGPEWSDARIEAFSARRILPDGSWSELQVYSRIITNTVRSLRSQELVQSHLFELGDIEAGDVVEVRWKYFIPYDLSWPHSAGWRQHYRAGNWRRLTSWRVFFHRTIPVRRQSVEVVYELKQSLVIGGPTASRVEEHAERVRLIWDQHDLPGCIDEVNARPAADLPFLSFRLQLDDPRNFARHPLSLELLPTPYWAQVIRWREQRGLWWRRVAEKRIPDRQNRLLKEFIARTTAGMEHLSPLARLKAVHDHIAKEFSWQDDPDWYAELDQSLDRMGDQVSHRILKQRSRYDLYAKIINELGLNYRTAYLLDARIGTMNNWFLTQLWDSPYAFVVQHGGEELVLVPKDGGNALLANELPFYWGGTNALVGDIDVLYGDPAPVPRFMEMPAGDEADLRRTDLRITVDPELGMAAATARIFLSGQFSTLCRRAYAGQGRDPSVDPVYGHRLQDAPGVELVRLDLGSVQVEAPFRQVIGMDLAFPKALESTSDTSWTLDLGQVIRHAVTAHYDAPGRDLPFQWDFAQDDKFSLIVTHPASMEMSMTGPTQGEWYSSGAMYRFTVQPHSNGTTHIVSQLIVHNPVEPVHARQAMDVLLRQALAAGSLMLEFRAGGATVGGR